jgi:hypothetical protein
MMEDFDVRPGHFKKLGGTDGLEALMKELFGGAKREGDLVVASFKLITRVAARFKDAKMVEIEILTDSSNPNHPDAWPTIQARNQFMERATGYTAKERKKKLEARAKKAGSGQ